MQQGIVFFGDVNDGIHGIGVEDGARGVVRVAQADHFRSGCNQLFQFVHVRRPVQIFFQVEGLYISTQMPGDSPDLHIVGQHDDDLVTRLNIAPGKCEIRFG